MFGLHKGVDRMGKWKVLLKKLWGSIMIFAAFVLALILCLNIL